MSKPTMTYDKTIVMLPYLDKNLRLKEEAQTTKKVISIMEDTLIKQIAKTTYETNKVLWDEFNPRDDPLVSWDRTSVTLKKYWIDEVRCYIEKPEVPWDERLSWEDGLRKLIFKAVIDSMKDLLIREEKS